MKKLIMLGFIFSLFMAWAGMASADQVPVSVTRPAAVTQPHMAGGAEHHRQALLHSHPASKASWDLYHADQVAYKASWDEKDVAKASSDSPTRECAAWPWINLANHQFVAGQAKQSEDYYASMGNACEALGNARGDEAGAIRAILKKHGPPSISDAEPTQEDGTN